MLSSGLLAVNQSWAAATRLNPVQSVASVFGCFWILVIWFLLLFSFCKGRKDSGVCRKKIKSADVSHAVVTETHL